MIINQENWPSGPMPNAVNPLQAKIEAIRAAVVRGESTDAIVARFATTPQAVENIRRGLGGRQRPMGLKPRTTRPARVGDPCPWTGCFVSTDGSNVSGWSRRRGEPRLAQTLAVCRWFSDHGVRFVCWFDANFRHCVAGLSRRKGVRDADVLDRILREQPDLFKQAPAGISTAGVPIKADPYVIRDADSIPGGLILSGDLYRREAQEHPELAGWTQRHPERRIAGQVAANGDVLLGENAEVRISVVDDAEYYIRY